MIHKKILIAGFLEQTRNYCAAFLLLGADTSVLCGTGRELSLLLADGRLPDPADFDGLVLPGGGDISPFFYHMENAGARNIDSLLDSVQFSLFQAFMAAGKPVLGICKGLQLINVAFGGTLIQELGPESLAIHAWEDADKIHITKAAHGTFPAQLYGSFPRVNSAHHQAVGVFGEGLRAAQYGPDFVVEALYHERLPVLGVQWHPERMCFSHAREDVEDGSKLLKYYLRMLR